MERDRLLKQFDPPADLNDFDGIPGQRRQWSDAVSGWFDEAIASELALFKESGVEQPCQFFNPTRFDPGGDPFDQPIVWNSFPRTLTLAYGQTKAYQVADELFPLSAPRPGQPTAAPFFKGEIWDTLVYRPQDEYCEWRATRDPNTGQILRITFTSEPPEYWQALHGDTLSNLKGTSFVYPFTGDPRRLLALYRELVSPYVQYEDLICHQDYVDASGDAPAVIYQKGAYNPYNKWNTTHGIMHLTHPANAVSAEIQLGADATVLRHKDKRLMVVADPLICCAGYGGSARSSDPTIGGSVNALARLGFWLTIQNPVGLYMNDLNTEGWTKPNGERIDPKEYFRVIRGRPERGEISRAVLEVPAKEGFTVSDIRIGGLPIRHGGQASAHINMKITGSARLPGALQNKPIPCSARCAIRKGQPGALTRPIPNTDPIPEGYEEAFTQKQGTFASAHIEVAPSPQHIGYRARLGRAK
jgi:hypothetical protein